MFKVLQSVLFERVSRSKSAAAFLFSIALSGNVFGVEIENDKVKHAVTGSVFYGVCVGFGAIADIDWINYKTCLIPLGVAAIGKEIYDQHIGKDPEVGDVVATMAVPVYSAGVTFIVLSW